MDDFARLGAAVLLLGLLLLLVAAGLCYDLGQNAGYRRGFCEGRGGVEATAGDSIRCIRPPTPVGVDSASTRRAG